jgi:hypothetical protein
MKKKLEAELISIAHRVLKLKNRSETRQLQEEAKKLYEQLTVLRFYEENIDVVEKEIAASDFEEKLAVFTSNEMPLQEEVAVEISSEVIAESVEEEVQELILEEMHSEEEIMAQEEALQEQEQGQEQPQVQFEKEIEEEILEEIIIVAEETVEEVIEEAPVKEVVQTQQISFEDVFGADFKEPEFVKVEDVPAEVEQAAELGFEAVEETEEAEEPIFETKTVMEEVKIERTETIQATKKTTFQEEPKSISLNDRLNKGINIGLNDRIAFEKRLFGGSADDFNRVLSQLNTFDSFEEAKGFIEDFVKPDYDNWNGKEEYEARFLEIVEKKFN